MSAKVIYFDGARRALTAALEAAEPHMALILLLIPQGAEHESEPPLIYNSRMQARTYAWGVFHLLREHLVGGEK